MIITQHMNHSVLVALSVNACHMCLSVCLHVSSEKDHAVALDGIRTKAMTAICILMAGFF